MNREDLKIGQIVRIILDDKVTGGGPLRSRSSVYQGEVTRIKETCVVLKTGGFFQTLYAGDGDFTYILVKEAPPKYETGWYVVDPGKPSQVRVRYFDGATWKYTSGGASAAVAFPDTWKITRLVPVEQPEDTHTACTSCGVSDSVCCELIKKNDKPCCPRCHYTDTHHDFK